MNDRHLSRRLAYLLRHAPHEAGLTLAVGGWVPLEPLLKHLGVDRERIERVVGADEKGRFALAGDRIRANQGHSVPVDLGLVALEPPGVLYHGTYQGAQVGIERHGLRAMNRHHVHLSPDTQTARRVGLRRGWPLVYAVDAAGMHRQGCVFFRSDNGVWLVDAVPKRFLRIVSTG